MRQSSVKGYVGSAFYRDEGGVNVIGGEVDVLIGSFVKVNKVGVLWEAGYMECVIDGVYVRGVYGV